MRADFIAKSFQVISNRLLSGRKGSDCFSAVFELISNSFQVDFEESKTLLIRKQMRLPVGNQMHSGHLEAHTSNAEQRESVNDDLLSLQNLIDFYRASIAVSSFIA